MQSKDNPLVKAGMKAARFLATHRKAALIGLSLIVLAGAAGFTYYRVFYLPSQASAEPEIQTAVVRQGDLVIYASGSGTLIAYDQLELGFGASGTVAELNVDVGDMVQAGDILAVQDDRDQLEAAVAADQLALLNAQNALQALYDDAALVAAQAQLDLANAKEDLRAAEYNWTVQQQGNRASALTLNAAEAAVVLAEESLERARDEYSRYSSRPEDDPARAMALTRLASAQQNYDSAFRTLNWYLGYPTEIQQAQLDAEVAIAEALVAQAERAWEAIKDGPDPEEVAMAELQVTNAEAALAVSQQNLEKSVVRAPMDGVILEVNARVGQSVSGNFITLADLSQLYLEVFLDESDMSMIAPGYDAEVVFDALPDAVFTGHVTRVDPSLYSAGMVSAVHGWVVLDDSAAAGLENLLIGMNAAVDIIAGRAEGAVLVPVEALRELSPGEYAVFVIENGTPRLRSVEVGLMDVTYAEITSGLEVGEVVTTGIVETE